ncbi:MAG: electron transfer flavoprotein subunit beta/FixA family protein [Paenibacillaceae bacterium]|uniref:Electron transfer flavoprotein subunit beta n=1 Tax=Paenibacillus mellifer TaxID=2937794 RepID=A0A9X2BTY0_9BACL|nr:electron transfer flavoprotein subunit beta/FixA family protein [Paenibacillus mellifer]MBW4839565.1 electron transfer flavoprotein subunit beta/FixA family protein [Paenibacillaceae bacterium]MCK8488406.1 electron transfer flavoprotein subunit beta/FixA family protein [Paenibacillus mellifer]
MQHVVVILKQTFDTEEKIVITDGKVSEDGVKFVINPYDEYAVEEALRLKEAHGVSVTVVSAGPDRAAEALRTALAMGADEAVRIATEAIHTDEYGISRLLAAFLQTQSYDLILGGNFSVDNGAGQVAVRLAKLLDLPHVSSITELTVNGEQATVVRDAEGDAETLEVKLPALLTAQQGLNEPRYPSLPGIMKAKKKPFRELSLTDLGLNEDEITPKTQRLGISLPPARQAGKLISGTPGEQVEELVRLLRSEAKVI